MFLFRRSSALRSCCCKCSQYSALSSPMGRFKGPPVSANVAIARCFATANIHDNNTKSAPNESQSKSKSKLKSKTDYNPPTIRTLYALKNARLRNRILLIALSSTIFVFAACAFYVEIVKFFSFGGGAYKMRREISKIVGEYGHDAKIAKQHSKSQSQSPAGQPRQQPSKEGWLSNSMIAGGKAHKTDRTQTRTQTQTNDKQQQTQKRDYTHSEREQLLGQEKYKSWQDLQEKGFPKTQEEYKYACKLRPEMMTDTLEQYTPLFDEEGNPARTLYYGKDAAYVSLKMKEREEDKFLAAERLAYGQE